MRYTYAYKTSDGRRHEATVDAESREAAFALLRKRGIKAIKVVAADGSKANGEVRGVRRRFVTMLALLVALLSGGIVYVANRDRFVLDPSMENILDQSILGPSRRQVIGDAALIDKGIRTGWSDVFEDEGDRFLASFAIPGVTAGVRNTSEAEIHRVLEHSVAIGEDDSLEARQIKAMVEGMKAEARAFVAAGGSVVEYGKMLVQRQEREHLYYVQAENEIARLVREKAPEVQIIGQWELRNASLRRMGIRPLPMPQ